MRHYLGRSLKLRVSFKEKSAEVVVVERNEPMERSDGLTTR